MVNSICPVVEWQLILVFVLCWAVTGAHRGGVAEEKQAAMTKREMAGRLAREGAETKREGKAEERPVAIVPPSLLSAADPGGPEDDPIEFDSIFTSCDERASIILGLTNSVHQVT